MIQLKPRISPEDYFAGFLGGLRAARLAVQEKNAGLKLDRMIRAHKEILENFDKPGGAGSVYAKIKKLTDNQFFMLDAINAYSGYVTMASMRRHILEIYGKKISLGRQADILGKFENSGWVTNSWSAGSAKPGGRCKKIYTIEDAGRGVLAAERTARQGK